MHGGAALVADRRPTVVVSGVASDSHTWNLVFLQLLIEELGYQVVNLGPTVPDELLVEECQELAPALIVLSSVNGHGFQDGLRVAGKLRDCQELAATPLVIGGKLGIGGEQNERQIGELLAAGFDAVFQDGATGLADFQRFINTAAGANRLAGSPGVPA
ncbi:methylaspartate mutase [Streptomyces tateyamensis]|uniref:Methylaspartate mutase n=1 Tax=Streptomyces tateyamensis TaxID=565073 RepID=A0A2V4NH75_9ACTN|nr:cobalamin-dependent protein [Streptomyces tateyamensis]PYC78622.1 methylaspartate mutase [Streptomyces tateyamensis]